MDCMEFMRSQEDKYFDLAVVDPPYGIENINKPIDRLVKHGNLHNANGNRPSKAFFKELSRISKNQIIWGYNHLSDLLPTCREFIFWNKHQPVKTYSDGELAWTSFLKTARCFDFAYFGAHGADDNRIHPTQKPIKLYEWIFDNYAKPGFKIIDTHLGSGSSAIAAHRIGLDFTGCEIDKTYFNAAKERVEQETMQMNLFLKTQEQYKQVELF
jgi:site-specific DNA-methyltransferase (adenine-specific)